MILIILAKLENDKYYTDPELAEYCVKRMREIIGEENITEYIEPSAGAGVFLDYFDKPFRAFDVKPEDTRIIKADWREVNIDYKPGRCVIGNPPFGRRNTLAVQFYKKAIQVGDYIGFILPISQLKNNQQMYEFDLVSSDDLGVREYSGRKIHCCYNIYRRPANGLNKKKTYKLKDVEIKEFRSKKKSLESTEEFDLRICFWGAAMGKVVKAKGTYSHEMGIKILNEKYKNEIIRIFREVDWGSIYHFVATPALYQWQIYKYLKEQIPALE